MNYTSALRYIYRLNFYENKKTMHVRLEKMLKLLNLDLHTLKYIHVTGSKGKGSASIMCAYMLKEAGYKVGLFLSPHAKKHTERIRVYNGEKEQLITEKKFANTIDRIRTLAKTHNIPLSTFDYFTLIGLTHFCEQRVDVAVIEVGMGGLHDPTNIIPSTVQIVTNIELEHTEELGDTIEKIAKQKLGIIKNNSICVLGDTQEKVLEISAKISKEKKATVWVVEDNDAEILSSSLKGNVFNFKEYSALETSLLGTHQVKNAILAVCAVNALRKNGIDVTPEAVRMGLKNATIPLRMQVVCSEPLTIIDGCHTEKSLMRFFETCAKFCPKYTKILVIGFAKGKDIQMLSETLMKNIDSTYTDIIVTSSKLKGENAKKVSKVLAEVLKKTVIKGVKPQIHTEPSVKKAVQMSKRLADKNTMIAVIGSLYLCAEV